jgi:hypothetical protein
VKQYTNYEATLSKSKIVGLLIIVLFALTACTRNTKATVALLPEATPTPVPAVTQTPANECLNCHVDKQRLIDTAKLEEVKVKESSGTG